MPHHTIKYGKFNVQTNHMCDRPCKPTQRWWILHEYNIGNNGDNRQQAPCWGWQQRWQQVRQRRLLPWEHHTLSNAHWMYDTLSAHWEHHALSAACWDYDTLSAACWEYSKLAPWESARKQALMLRASYSQQARASYSQHHPLRVWYSQRLLRASYSKRRPLRASYSQCHPRMRVPWDSALRMSVPLSWKHYTLSGRHWKYDTLSACWEHHTLSGWRWEYDTLKCAESIILSAPLAESVMLSAPQKHFHGSVGGSNFWYFRLVFFFRKVSSHLTLTFATHLVFLS